MEINFPEEVTDAAHNGEWEGGAAGALEAAFAMMIEIGMAKMSVSFEDTDSGQVGNTYKSIIIRLDGGRA